jgi:HPt (histidine-containing phosphotransfer) domain-containing protein
LRAITQGDAELEREVFILFAEQTDLNLAAMRGVLSAASTDDGWSEAAHMIKGAAANIGAVRLARVAGEAQLYKGHVEGRRDLLARTEAAYAELLASLRAAGLYS